MDQKQNVSEESKSETPSNVCVTLTYRGPKPPYKIVKTAYKTVEDIALSIHDSETKTQLDIKYIEVVDFMDVLFKYIYNTVELVSVTYTGNREKYKNKKFHPRTNMWYFSDAQRGEHDPDIECECDSNCDLDHIVIGDCNHKTLDYEFKFKPEVADTNYVFQDDENKAKLFVKLSKFLKTKDFKKISIVSESTIHLRNPFGINQDHRGSDHMAIQLDFNNYFGIEYGTNPLEEFFDAAFRVKSHKFDFNYELFCGVSTRIYPTALAFDLYFDFDHGS